MDGKIHVSGKLSKEESTTNISLEKVPKGDYHLFIINEGMIFKKLLSFRN
ncbi:MAG: hypothetical protein RJQ00_03460 [Vicingaceae bacterium]